MLLPGIEFHDDLADRTLKTMNIALTLTKGQAVLAEATKARATP